MIREGSTPAFNIKSISALEAQSNPVPRAARSRITSELGLHFTAIQRSAANGAYLPLSLTIVWFDSFQVHLPAQMLPVDFPHIGHEEGIFLASIADIDINVFDTLGQSLPNNGSGGAMYSIFHNLISGQ